MNALIAVGRELLIRLIPAIVKSVLVNVCRSIKFMARKNVSIKLVKFSNGKFGVRRGNWFTGYRYKDLYRYGNRYWWDKKSKFFRDCMSSEESARKFFEAFKDKKMELKRNFDIRDEVIE